MLSITSSTGTPAKLAWRYLPSESRNPGRVADSFETGRTIESVNGVGGSTPALPHLILGS